VPPLTTSTRRRRCSRHSASRSQSESPPSSADPSEKWPTSSRRRPDDRRCGLPKARGFRPWRTLAPDVEPARHLHDRDTIADHREHCLIPLLHDAQLHQRAGSVSRIRRSQRHPSAGAAKPIRRSHVGRHLAGQRVAVECVDGLLHVTHYGVLVATHARRHLPEDDERIDRRAKASRPARPTRATRSFPRSTRQARPASLGPATASLTGTSDRSSGFAWSPTPFRSPRTAVCFARAHHKQGQGVRSPGQPRWQTKEERSGCRIGTGATSRHGYRDFTPAETRS
jgi:hypothetical protein